MKKRIIPKTKRSYEQWLHSFDSMDAILDYVIEHTFSVKELKKFYALPDVIKPLIQYVQRPNEPVPYNHVNGIKELYLQFCQLSSRADCQRCLDLLKNKNCTDVQRALILGALRYPAANGTYLPPPVESIINYLNHQDSSNTQETGVYWWYDESRRVKTLQKLDSSSTFTTEHLFTMAGFYLYLSGYLFKEDHQFVEEVLTAWVNTPGLLDGLAVKGDFMKDALPWYDSILSNELKQQFFAYLPLTVLRSQGITVFPENPNMLAVIDMDPTLTWNKWNHPQPSSEMEVHW